MDTYFAIAFDRFGFVIDSAPVYVSLSWPTLGVLVLSAVVFKIYKVRKAN